MKKTIPVLLISILFINCGGNEMAEHASVGFFTINYEDALAKKREYLLSEIATDVKYTRLETNDSCLIRQVVDYFITDSLIFVRNFDHILKFSREGKFIQKIGKPGRGPGEIDLIRIMSVLPEKQLIIIQLNYQRKLYYYSFDGKLLKVVDFRTPVDYVRVCPDGRYLLHYRGAEGNERYSFVLATEKWDTLSRVRNYMNWVNTSEMVITIGYRSFKEFYSAGDMMYMKDMYNDTIYCIEKDRIRPAYFLDLGRFRLPEALRPEKLGPNQVQQFHNNAEKYFFGTMIEGAGKIFLATHSYRNAPPRFVVVDKTTTEATHLIDKGEPAKGFINDWDGGLDFWPVETAAGNEVIMPLNVMELRKLNEEKGWKKALFPEKQEDLKEMISGLEPTDNPVICIVTLKE